MRWTRSQPPRVFNRSTIIAELTGVAWSDEDAGEIAQYHCDANNSVSLPEKSFDAGSRAAAVCRRFILELDTIAHFGGEPDDLALAVDRVRSSSKVLVDKFSGNGN